MNYNETLLRFVKGSEMTLRDIAKQCKEDHNVKINPSYISKLTSENHPPASDEVNEAIALVTGNDPEELYFTAYLSKAPNSVITLIENIVEYLKKFTGIMIKNQYKKEMAPIIDKAISDVGDWRIIKELLADKMDMPDENNNVLVKTHDPNMKDIMFAINPISAFKMPDDAMEPLIPKGVMLQFGPIDDLQENEVVLAYQKDTKDPYIRRYMKMGKGVVLLADNPRFKPIRINEKKDVLIASRVKSYTKEL